MSHLTVALAGNPNVGKSSIFNALTGLHQHTGNWAGKTVENARGTFQTKHHSCTLVDLPGAYSLSARSEEERVAREYLLSGGADVIVVICDATCLQRGLHLALQCLMLSEKIMLCINLMDEAEKRGIRIDTSVLSNALCIPVVSCSARKKQTLSVLKDALDTFVPTPDARLPESTPREIAKKAEKLFQESVSCPRVYARRSLHALEQQLLGSVSGLIWMLLSMALLLWITITGANAVSDVMKMALKPVGEFLDRLFVHSPALLHDMLMDGMWRVLSWVVAVMLPPMMIFFPLFTLLEDAGLLPRIAFALDRPFQACNACGKQALTCCMGLGCNAAGVTGCRIIDSRRERLLAILTNCLTPCSGRFPMLASLSAAFWKESGSAFRSALIMTGLFALSLFFTFLATRLLSGTVLRGEASSFVMELPPFRRPQFGSVLLRSVLDRTVFVLGRAAMVAAPAGMLIWIVANVSIGDRSLLKLAADALNPLGTMMGMDGFILLAFLLGLPANEIVLPLILMGYLSSAVLPELSTAFDLRSVLIANHWTAQTALCVSIFTLAHWPCSTTILTIYKETHSLRWTIIGILLPALIGTSACLIVHTVCILF